MRYSFAIQCSSLDYFVGFVCSQLKRSSIEGKTYLRLPAVVIVVRLEFFRCLLNIENVLR